MLRRSRNPDVDKLNTVFDKIDQEHKTLIDSMIDNCVDSTFIAAVTHNKFEFDTRREEWFLKIRGSFCDDANLPSSSKPGPDLLSSKAPSECSRSSNSSSKSSNVSGTSSRISMRRLRAREKLKLAQLEAAQLKEVIEEEKLKQRIRQREARRKLELANAQYEIWMEADIKAERDLEVKSRDPLGSPQSKKELSLPAKPFSPAISNAFPSSSLQLIKSGAESKADIIRAPESQNAPLPQSGRVNFAPEMTSNLCDYRSAGVGQHYFPDETVDELGPSHAPKTAPVSLLYPYAVKYDDLFLPRPELSKFSGDPLEFKLFISNFETHVESRLQDQRALLCLLVQHCTDPVKEKIQHFFETGQNCYRLAKDRLFKEYGSPWIVSDVCEQRLKKFPSIISGDAKELKRFAELLEKCSVIVKDIRCYSNLDSLDTLTLLVKKLPYNLRTRWVKRAVQVENRSGELANFSHFSEFVQQESEEANSLFGLRSLNVKPSTSKVKASYTTTFFNSSDRGLKPQNRWGECWYCKSSIHRLIDCKEFIKILINDL